MKMNFPHKAKPSEPCLDHGLLLAALAAQKASGAAAKSAEGDVSPSASEEPITEILLAGPGWRRARSAQQGCFHRDEAERRP